MIRAVSVQTMRESDAWTIENRTSSKELMFRAGKGIVDAADWKDPIGIVCGKGNNAGDGYVAAALLREAGHEVTLILLSDSFSEDGRYYYDIAREKGVPSVAFEENKDLSSYGSLLDCLLGTGFRGEAAGLMKEAIEAINRSGAYIICADINSGLNGDSGLGTTFVHSDLTVSIGTFKTGHFYGMAKEAMKEKVNVDIGIEIRGPFVVITE